MKNQKICIIGAGLTGLVTAIGLSNLGCKIDLFADNRKKKIQSNRTIAISEDNLKFLIKFKIFETLKNQSWPSNIMELYTGINNQGFSKVFELNHNKKEVFHMIENSKLIKLMTKKIKQSKLISFKNTDKISSIYNSNILKKIKFKNKTSKYNLVIVCTGHNSDLVKSYFNDHLIENSYNEKSITTIINHSSVQNNIARQIFFENEIFALLPISNNKTSIVWSIKKNPKIQSMSYIKKKVKSYAGNFYRKIIFSNKIESKDLYFLIRKNYYQDRMLLFGDALHVVHPFVGQGFNMTLRDLSILEKLLKKKINLGLDIGSSDILSEFSSETKPGNFIFSIGIDVLKNYFLNYKLKTDMLKIINKSNFAKNIVFDVANKGFRF